MNSHAILQVKKDYLAGTGDSFDLVVIGGYQGRGKRSDWYGAYLLACYDPEGERYQAICKIGTGFSDEQLAKFHSELKPLEIAQKKSYYDVGEAKPEVFFEPQYVWEILAADLSLSPVYSAAKGLVRRGQLICSCHLMLFIIGCRRKRHLFAIPSSDPSSR